MSNRTRENVISMMHRLGGRYSSALGVDLSKGDSGEIFKWFLASILFGARISEKIAAKTYGKFVEERLLSPDKILAAGWGDLVKVLDSGGYARYDFKTADKLLEVMKNLKEKYGGDLNKLHGSARDSTDLEVRIKALGKGLDPVTVNIFLRELRGVWKKAKPLPQDLVIEGAKAIGISGVEAEDRKKALEELERVWKESNILGWNFADFEAALVRLGKETRGKAGKRKLT